MDAKTPVKLYRRGVSGQECVRFRKCVICVQDLVLSHKYYSLTLPKRKGSPLTLLKRLVAVLQTTEEDVLAVSGYLCVKCKRKLDNIEKLKKLQESLKSSFELARSSKDVTVSKRMVNSPVTGPGGREPSHAIKPSERPQLCILGLAYADRPTADMDRASPTHVPDTDSTIVDSLYDYEKRKQTTLDEVELYEDDGWLADSDEDSAPTPTKKRCQSQILPLSYVYRSPEEITKDELDMVAKIDKVKVYNQEYGSTCHQCGHKTWDMKSICRSSSCNGVRGQFCGPCLSRRYGESAEEALLDDDWTCPICRGICNCSNCLKKAGRHATGVLTHLAEEGI